MSNLHPVPPRFRSGDWVEVRSTEEILRTLDDTASMDGLPFMPQMLEYCGRRFRVAKSAHKTCDTIDGTGGRRMARAVHLEGLRCDGRAYGGCQAHCLLFWKEAWLKPVDGPGKQPGGSGGPTPEALQRVQARTRTNSNGDHLYRCQATELKRATEPLPWWDVRQYWADLRSRNVTFGHLVGTTAMYCLHRLIQLGIGYRALVRLYNRLQSLRSRPPYPYRSSGSIPRNQPTPTSELNLRPGELVRIKPFDEIRKTLNTARRNRGLLFDVEMVPFCGGTYRVLHRVERIIDERTGRMREMKSPCIILGDVYCRSEYSDCRLFCPRSIYSYWREIWLERVDPGNLSGLPGSDAPLTR